MQEGSEGHRVRGSEEGRDRHSRRWWHALLRPELLRCRRWRPAGVHLAGGDQARPVEPAVHAPVADLIHQRRRRGRQVREIFPSSVPYVSWTRRRPSTCSPQFSTACSGCSGFCPNFLTGHKSGKQWIFQGDWRPVMFSMFRLLPKLLACTKKTRGIFINVSFLQRVDLKS
jgi:hypothetical protein